MYDLSSIVSLQARTLAILCNNDFNTIRTVLIYCQCIDSVRQILQWTFSRSKFNSPISWAVFPLPHPVWFLRSVSNFQNSLWSLKWNMGWAEERVKHFSQRYSLRSSGKLMGFSVFLRQRQIRTLKVWETSTTSWNFQFLLSEASGILKKYCLPGIWTKNKASLDQISGVRTSLQTENSSISP